MIASRLIATLQMTCERFNLDPDKVHVMVVGDGSKEDMTYISVKMMDDGIVWEDYDYNEKTEEETLIGYKWADRDKTTKDDMYRCAWIEIKQTQ